MLYDALVVAGGARPRARAPSVLRGQARRPALDAPGDDPPPDDPRGAPRQARGAPEGRRPVRVRPRRRGGAGPRARRASPSRWCPASRARSRRPRSPASRSPTAASRRRFVVVSGPRRVGLRGPCSRACAPGALDRGRAHGPGRRAAPSRPRCSARGWPARDAGGDRARAPSTPRAHTWIGHAGASSARPSCPRRTRRAPSSSATSWSSRASRALSRTTSRRPGRRPTRR